MDPAIAFDAPYDLAFVALYAFWVLFALLVLYLHSESKREGFPLVTDRRNERPWGFFGWRPRPKTYILAHGGTVVLPQPEEPKPVAAVQTMPFFGAPYVPTGNALVDGVGPAAWADRADVPDLTFDDATPKIVPLRSSAAKGWTVPEDDPDPRGMDVRGADHVVVGKCVDLWVDRSEALMRYIEVELAGSGRHILVPSTMITIEGAKPHVMVQSMLSPDFANAPGLRNPEQVTLREEDRIVAYFGGGDMYSTRARAEPFL